MVIDVQVCCDDWCNGHLLFFVELVVVVGLIDLNGIDQRVIVD